MLKGTYTPKPLDSSAKRAGEPRSHKETPATEVAPLPSSGTPQTPSTRTPGKVNSTIADNVRAGFQVGGAEGEHQEKDKQASADSLEAQRSKNVIK